MLDQLKSSGTSPIISGDGRHDSMGHIAKYGAYTIFCCNIPKIIHFWLQVIIRLLYIKYTLYHKVVLKKNWWCESNCSRIVINILTHNAWKITLPLQ